MSATPTGPAPAPPRGSVWLWLAAFFAFAAVAHGNFETTDAGFTMHSARALWLRGDSGLLRAEQGGDLLGEQLGAEWIRQHDQGGHRRDGAMGRFDRAYPWFPIGHVWLLVPLVAAGEALRQSWPAADAAFRQRVAPGVADDRLGAVDSWVQGHPVVVQGLIALLLPPAVGATLLVLLARLSLLLGVAHREALVTALAIVFATQAFALGRETLSDGPGLVCLVGALLTVVAVHQGRGGPGLAFAGGLVAGGAVLLRYQAAFLVGGLLLALLLACRRQGRWRVFAAFVAGGLPALAGLLAVNVARFGDAFDTGYPRAADWLDQPVWLGAAKLLFGAGRGLLWLSPLLWLALPAAWSRRQPLQLRWLLWFAFLVPLVFFARARGWHGGQNWGARYLTPAVVVLLAIVLPQLRPWQRWPWRWRLLVAAGLFASLTSVVAPVRGVLQLGAQAVAATGGGPADDVTGWHPRYTPLLANWRYALASRVGGFEDEQGRRRDGSAHTIEALFGVPARTAAQGYAPDRWEDRCGRHLWWRFWGDLTGVPGALLLLPVALAAAACGALAWRCAGKPPKA